MVALLGQIKFNQLQVDHLTWRRNQSVNALNGTGVLVGVKGRGDELGGVVGEPVDLISRDVNLVLLVQLFMVVVSFCLEGGKNDTFK